MNRKFLLLLITDYKKMYCSEMCQLWVRPIIIANFVKTVFCMDSSAFKNLFLIDRYYITFVRIRFKSTRINFYLYKPGLIQPHYEEL